MHFPIALLTIYGLAELVRAKKLLAAGYWFYLKAILVILGTLSALPTLLSGKAIEDLFSEQLVQIHSSYALATTILFALISISYLVSWIDKDFYLVIKNIDSWRNVSQLNKNIFRSRVLVLLALIGLGMISITGALGGIIAFGPNVDPLSQFVNGLFFGK